MTSQNKQATVHSEDVKEKGKKGMLRLPGLIAFLIIVVLIGGGSYFFAGSVIKSVIETTGTSMNGAKVEVDKVSLGLFPASLTLNNMTVADPEKPMQNLIEFSTAQASIELTKLLMGQVIIPDLAMQGLQFETARRTSGAIEKKNHDASSTEGSNSEKASHELKAELSEKLPSAKDILAREPLLVDQRQRELEKAYKEQKVIWEQTKSTLPDKDKLKDYEKRAKAITDSKIKSYEDFKVAKEKLDQLKSEIKADKNAIKQAQDKLKESKEILEAHVINLKNAPKEDWNMIKDKYSFDQQGLTNVSSLLFGEQIGEYTTKALYWYEKLKPYLEDVSFGGEDAAEEEEASEELGRFVRFPEENPVPDFLIKQALVSTVLPNGNLDLRIQDITHQQNILGRPTRVKANSNELKGIEAFRLEGVLDYRKQVSQSNFEFSLDKAAIDAFELGSSQGADLALDSAQSDIKGVITLIDHAEVKGEVNAQFSNASFAGTASNRFTEELLAALTSIKEFNIDADVKGSVEDADINIKSDIDRRLKNAFSKRIDEKTKELKEEINKGLNEKLAAYIPESNNMTFTGAESLDDYSNKLEDLLKSKVDDFAEQQKQKAQDKLKEKFKSLF